MSVKEWFLVGVLEAIRDRRHNLRSKLALLLAKRKVIEIMDEKKKWYTSKTLIFNAIMGLLQVAGTLAAPEGGLSPEYQKIWASVVLIGNAVLRVFFTSTPIGK